MNAVVTAFCQRAQASASSSTAIFNAARIAAVKSREHLKDLPGELHERPWRDFAYNRSEALTLARPHGDYTLIIDADDVLEFGEEFRINVEETHSPHP
jgi:hypothetical protein